jgi:hypothetical protein
MFHGRLLTEGLQVVVFAGRSFRYRKSELDRGE